MIKEIIMGGFLLLGQPSEYKADLVKLQNLLKAEGVDITEYVKDPRFEIYRTKKLNRKAATTDYSDPLQSSYMRPSSIQNCMKFMNEQKEWLELAEKLYGVDEEYVTALLNLESSLGKNTGDYLVFNALVSQYLNTKKDGRKKFFYEEIKEFLKLTKEMGISDIFKLKGSFAGAMGPMQFMPSSMRRYAVDFDGDGLGLNDMEDAIGSSARFLKENGFKKGSRNRIKRSLRAYWNNDNYVNAIIKQAELLKSKRRKIFRRKNP